VQTDIAKQVSDALRIKIRAPEIDRIDKKPTESTKAYTLYLRGRYHLNKRGIEDIKKAEEYFEQAVREDPNFALGYVGLADCNQLLASRDIEVIARQERAKTMIGRALEIDPDLAEAHATRGLVLGNSFNLQEAEEELRKAIELKPSYATTHHWYFLLLLMELRWDEALAEIEKAVELDPLSQVINVNHAFYYAAKRDNARALDLYKKAEELDPNTEIAHLDLAPLYGRMKMFDEMEQECKILNGLFQESYPQVVRLTESIIAYFKNDSERVRSLMPELEAHVGEPLSPGALEVAGLYFLLAEKDKGFEWLEKSYSRKEPNILYIQTFEMFDGIRADPRYQNLLERLGLKQRSHVLALT